MHVCTYIYNNYFYLLLLFVTLLKHTYHFFITMNNVMQQKLALCDTPLIVCLCLTFSCSSLDLHLP